MLQPLIGDAESKKSELEGPSPVIGASGGSCVDILEANSILLG